MPIYVITNKSLTDNVATLTTASAHGISASGKYITVSGVDATFNGSYTVSAVSASNQFSYAKTATNVSPAAASGSVIYATIDTTGRPAYMYDSQTDTWIKVGAEIDTGANYTWNGAQTYESTATYQDDVTYDANVTYNSGVDYNGNLTVGSGSTNYLDVTGSASFTESIQAKKGVNVFATTGARDSAIPSPAAGTIVYITGTNQQLVYNGSAWVAIESGSGMEDIFLLMGA
jgi:hypothetical protein